MYKRVLRTFGEYTIRMIESNKGSTVVSLANLAKVLGVSATKFRNAMKRLNISSGLVKCKDAIGREERITRGQLRWLIQELSLTVPHLCTFPFHLIDQAYPCIIPSFQQLLSA